MTEMFYRDLKLSAFYLIRRSIITGFLAIFFLVNQAEAGHKIKGTISGYESDAVYLAMLYGGNQYVVDTATVTNGSFVFESVYQLHSGVYLVVLPPTQSFLLLIDQNLPEFSFTADSKNLDSTLRFEGSPDNTEYYDYLKFFQAKRIQLDKIKSEYDAQKNDPDRVELLAKMQQLKKEVITYQTELVARTPGTLTAAMIKCELPVEVPNFGGSPEEIQFKKYLHQKEHFFDNTDLTDERLIRAPKNVLVDRVDYYLDNLTVQQPDSLNKGVDLILSMSERTPVAYRFFLTHLFNKYREANKIGMDGVYVHIAENYIGAGKAPWIERDERDQIMDAVKHISPTLIGRKAPNFSVQTKDQNNISLYDIESPYTVLFFWSPTCTHCQEVMPKLGEFYKAYKDKGVQVFAVCTKVNEQEKNCWEYLDEQQFPGWINASDKTGGNSLIHQQYNIKTTPKVYVLGKDKTIIAKDFGVEHLEEVMKRLLL